MDFLDLNADPAAAVPVTITTQASGDALVTKHTVEMKGRNGAFTFFCVLGSLILFSRLSDI